MLDTSVSDYLSRVAKAILLSTLFYLCAVTLDIVKQKKTGCDLATA